MLGQQLDGSRLYSIEPFHSPLFCFVRRKGDPLHDVGANSLRIGTAQHSEIRFHLAGVTPQDRGDMVFPKKGAVGSTHRRKPLLDGGATHDSRGAITAEEPSEERVVSTAVTFIPVSAE